MIKRFFVVLGLCCSFFSFPIKYVAAIQVSPTEVLVLDRSGKSVIGLTDGDTVKLQIKTANPAPQQMEIQFAFNFSDHLLASCTIPASERECTSTSFSSLGWYWGFSASASDNRVVVAEEDGQEIGRSGPLKISPRPVILVHGFISNYQAWKSYLGPDGFLEGIGLQGFAVGDGQVSGTLNTGKIDDPHGRTNTIFQNAEVLQQYIDGVKQLTGAQMVDLIGHSMGGMISRVYIDRLMAEGADRDVAQLIMLGTPSLGSDCANLPIALGWYLPAALEIRSSYARQILNPQIVHRKGVQFSALAGDPILKPIGSPCTQVPSDSVVSLSSVSAIPLDFSKIPVLHTSLNTSDQAFEQFVSPLLKKSPDKFTPSTDPSGSIADNNPIQQFSRIYTGHLNPGESQALTIHIEAGVTLASFAMHNPDSSLETVVTGASGNQINLDTDKNGLLIVDEPGTLVQLGYGFNDPKPGVWTITLKTTESTPVEGTDYALTARFNGGGVLQADIDKVLPEIGEPVAMNASLSIDDSPLPIQSAEARIHRPDGEDETIQLDLDGDKSKLEFKPDLSGLYGIDLLITGKSTAGDPIERSAFFTIEAQPVESPVGKLSVLLLKILGVSVIGIAGLVLIAIGLIRRSKNTRKP